MLLKVKATLLPGKLVSQLCPAFCNPMDCSPPGFFVLGFPSQEYLSGLSFLSPGYLHDSGIRPGSPALQADSLPPGKLTLLPRGSHTPSHLFQNFSQFIVIHTVKDFGIVNKAEIDVFQNSFAFSMFTGLTI